MNTYTEPEHATSWRRSLHHAPTATFISTAVYRTARTDETVRLELPTPQQTSALWDEAPPGYRGHHRRPSRGIARPVTVAAIVGLWATALTLGLNAVGAW